MKKILLTTVAVTLLLSACSVYEEINLGATEKSNYRMGADLSTAMELLASMGGDKEIPDSLKEKVMDTTFSAASEIDALPITLTKEERTYFEKGSTHMVMNFKNKTFTMDMEYPVKNIQDFQRFLEVQRKIDSVKKTMKLAQDDSEGLANIGSNPLDKFPIKKSPYIITANSIERVQQSKEEMQDSYGEMFAQLESMMSQMTQKITIRVPTKITKVTGDRIKIQADGNTAIFSCTMAELLENPQLGAFLIEF
jgi:hypothetical protein